MKNKFLTEISISVILIILLTLMLDPFMVLMPTPAQMTLIAFVLVIFVAFAAFIWREKPNDEREELHKHIASRFAYLSGIAVLILGVVIQSLNHKLDPWIIIAAVVMIIAKIVGVLYANNKH